MFDKPTALSESVCSRSPRDRADIICGYNFFSYDGYATKICPQRGHGRPHFRIFAFFFFRFFAARGGLSVRLPRIYFTQRTGMPSS